MNVHHGTHGGRHPHGLPPVRVPVPALRPPRRGSIVPRPDLRAARPRAVAVATWTALIVAVLALAALLAGPRLGLYRVDVVLSGSMSPSWEAGDLVVTVPRRPQDLRVGDVVTFNPPIAGRPSVTHRIVELTEPGSAPVIRTRGDANPGVDPWGAVRLGADRVWVVTRTIPNAGWAVAFLQQRWIALAATVVAPILLGILLLVGIWRPARSATP